MLDISISLLFVSVFTLFCYMIPGFILRKTNVANEGFPKSLSIYTLYVAQVAMILHGFIVEFDIKVLKGLGLALLFGLVAHIIFYFIAKRLFKKAPDKIRRVLRFGIIFSNAGYMGIPVIDHVFGSEYIIYATGYIVWFNVFAFSLGRLIYTDDKSFISIKKIFINPAVIPIIIGFVIFLTGGGGWVQAAIAKGGFLGESVGVFYNLLTVLKNTVAPISMMVIGARLADIDFKGIFKDKYMYPFVLIRLVLFPSIVWMVMRVFNAIGFLDSTTMSIVLILSSAPAAALTTMFAEFYGGDSAYAGKLVALTTLLSVVTIPLVALLLYI